MSASAAAAAAASRVTVVSFENRVGNFQSMMLEHDAGVTREAIVKELEAGAGGKSFIIKKSLPNGSPGKDVLQMKFNSVIAAATIGNIYLVG